MTVEDCAEQVKRFDYERYLTALLAPAARRNSLWALYAFNHEIARIETMVREPMMGLVRYQWWHDAITRLYAGEAPEHDVLKAVANCLKNGESWQEADFHAVIDGFESSFQNLDETLAVRAAQRSVPLLRMLCPQVSDGVLVTAGSAFETCRLLQAGKHDPNETRKLVDDMLYRLSALDRKMFRRHAPLAIALIAERSLKRIASHKYDVKNGLQHQRIFMLPLYLFVKTL